MKLIRFAPLPLFILAALLSTGCHRDAKTTVVLYTSVDEPYVKPLMQKFTQQTGIAVDLRTDAEASKSVGLSERLLAEKDHPNADVWWDNECFLTVRLADEGVLAPYDSPAAADVPAQYKDPKHLWSSSILRVRVLVSAATLAANKRPAHLKDLLNADFRNRVALARPTAGTTGGQVAVLYSKWGDADADKFFAALHGNGVKMVGGNSIVAEFVAKGDMLAGLCDNDDAASAQAEVGKLNVALPDQGDGEMGTLAMPCAVALVAGAPHSEAAKKLIDFLLSAQTDQAMIDAKFAWCSARNIVGKGKFMDVDYAAVAHEMPAAIRRATALMDGR